ncbi:DUF6174 domain-containing protein [Streptomyces sp. 378]|uniref:DUF6174 domain-containing protein n=1 Tax=Streptomyces sp. 378 TaxID=3049412 RepID=UPI0024C30EC8|nr:DUF6174 domain-containing protein [Streptomyces sp. 378]MDK1342894.1 DUF6174 domain-containing protein [Streptomyces sp. 378]
MTAAARAVRAVSGAVLSAGLICAVAACGSGTSTSPTASAAPGTPSASGHSGVFWREPASYAYTLRSSEGERNLLGTFRVWVRDGAVVKAVGLDGMGRRAVESTPDAVPALGELLRELEQARQGGADTAEAEYAPGDGHPVRIVLDWEENAVDDEARYTISAYAPADGRRAGDPAEPRPAS